MVNESDSRYAQPIITLGVPGNEITNRAMTWVLFGVAGLFLLIILVFAISSDDDSSGTAEGDASASATTMADIDEWPAAAR